MWRSRADEGAAVILGPFGARVRAELDGAVKADSDLDRMMGVQIDGIHGAADPEVASTPEDDPPDPAHFHELDDVAARKENPAVKEG